MSTSTPANTIAVKFIRPKKKNYLCFRLDAEKKLGSVGRKIFFFFF